MKTVIYILLLFIVFFNNNNSAFAQVDNHPWCPSGATWLYQRIGFFSQQHIKLTYIKDTIINNETTKVLQVSDITIVGPGPLPNYAWSEQQAGFEYFLNRNDSIFRWHNGQFWFLYDFNAVSGDEWVISENDDYACTGTTLPTRDTFTVVTIANQTYDNVTFETISGFDNGNWSIGQTIVKNIGSLRTPYPIPINNDCYGIDGATHLPSALNCYYDDLRGHIIFNAPPSNDCNFALTPIKNLQKSSQETLKVTIFPNPTSNEFSVLTETDNAIIQQYEIFDINGKKLESNVFYSNKPISIQNYPNGVYFLILITTDKSKHPFKVVKL